MTAYRRCIRALQEIPHCADLTRRYCSRYSGILLVDGKFAKVKGFRNKIPVIYGIDYLTHDIPTFRLSSTENYISLLTFFQTLRLLNYPLKSVVSDDNINIPKACLAVYPKAIWQLCLNHYKENIRRSLEVRTNDTYRSFMHELETLFKHKRSEVDFNCIAENIFNKYQSDERCISILLDIEKRKKNLMAYLYTEHTPRTTNLIECFNSHLSGRLKTIKGFKSYRHARLWMNGYFIRRRLKKFTDCAGKFKKLNGRCSLEIVAKDKCNLPNNFV